MTSNWETILRDRLPLYGHRNWIVIADSAYPAQSSQGIETVVSGDEHVAVLARALNLLRNSHHVKPTIYTDQELRFVTEKDAPGVASYREQLNDLLKGEEVCVLPHEEIISKLDEVGDTFRVLLIKTNLRIPYTSVFFQLECGYWNAQAESKLRAAMRPSARNAARRKGRR